MSEDRIITKVPKGALYILQYGPGFRNLVRLSDGIPQPVLFYNHWEDLEPSFPQPCQFIVGVVEEDSEPWRDPLFTGDVTEYSTYEKCVYLNTYPPTPFPLVQEVFYSKRLSPPLYLSTSQKDRASLGNLEGYRLVVMPSKMKASDYLEKF